MNLDITYCANRNCKFTKCMRHYNNTPKNVNVSVALLEVMPNLGCNWRFDTNWETVEAQNGK